MKTLFFFYICKYQQIPTGSCFIRRMSRPLRSSRVREQAVIVPETGSPIYGQIVIPLYLV
jgi:hypothetical protein